MLCMPVRERRKPRLPVRWRGELRADLLADALGLAGKDIEAYEILLDLGAASVRGLEEYIFRGEEDKTFLTQQGEGWHVFNLIRCANAEIPARSSSSY